MSEEVAEAIHLALTDHSDSKSQSRRENIFDVLSDLVEKIEDVAGWLPSTDSVESIVLPLERIADALEKLAGIEHSAG